MCELESRKEPALQLSSVASVTEDLLLTGSNNGDEAGEDEAPITLQAVCRRRFLFLALIDPGVEPTDNRGVVLPPTL